MTLMISENIVFFSFSHCLRMKLQLYSRTHNPLYSPFNLLILLAVSLLSLPSLQPLPSTWHTCHSLFITFYDLSWPLSLLIMFSLHVMLSPLLHLSNFYSSFNSKLKCQISFLAVKLSAVTSYVVREQIPLCLQILNI